MNREKTFSVVYRKICERSRSISNSQKQTRRCLCHLVVIAVNRILSVGHAAKPASPQLLAAMEQLRDFCRYYHKKPDHIAAFYRHRRCTGLSGCAPVLDSSSKWESTFAMLQDLEAGADLWRAVALRNEFEDHPPYPSDRVIALCLSCVRTLELVQSCLAMLQRSDALAATYIPLTHALGAEIAALPVFPVPPPVVPVVPGQEEPTFAQAFLDMPDTHFGRFDIGCQRE